MSYNFFLRKLVHLLYGSSLAILSYLNEDLRLLSIVITSILLLLYLAYTFTKLRWRSVEKYLQLLSRERIDIKAICYACGIIFSLLLFEGEIMLSSILILSFSDSLTAIFGKWLLNSEHKSISGSIIHFASDFIILINFFPIHLTLITSLVAATLDYVTDKFENLIIPIFIGAFLTFVTG
ncbi:MAG: hypothetical protein QW507_02040 [Candidatus Nanoarchaeia archaeon]|nr:hypothetical protein [Candidatus Haiyanarchaeum thermophilum]MCW1302806.1 hypothetical protein [Candidatus Haiyanarchaeum thermophilum]MCW1303487.1 hypothetical protein [Candidatus Haiyanarchaeum thermophilum]MCW1306667.1 hypothetical protein [Candidatus Haiyanarchaeum thermophilum]MCW1307377.1 hypothetical protein [Candidatus Haiyanarchaeum thermophilum]